VRGIAVGSFVAPAAVVVDRAFLAAELGRPGDASMLVVHGDDHDAAGALAAAIGAAHDVEATPWGTDDPFVRAAVASSDTIGAISATMVALGVLIPVWALLHIHVLHRRRQIALLVATGFGRGTVFAVSLTQALLIGAVGSAIGVAAGWALVHWFTTHPVFDMEGFVVVPLVSLRTFVWPVLLVLGATVAAGVLPAWRASRVEPARVLRGIE
jgi:ABC-type lipoprotein release transport system permease subunit